MTEALRLQHGGNHYKDKPIQPVEFAMANGYDCCIFSAIKYVTRHDSKNGEEDLRKGEHFVFLRLATMMHRAPVRASISPKFYCEQNRLGSKETVIILALHDWASGGREVGPYIIHPEELLDDTKCAKLISNAFNALIASAYPH